jgi:hypothetical protein
MNTNPMDTNLKLFIFEPTKFFQIRADSEDRSLFAILTIFITFLADLLTKTVVFYKIGIHNLKSQVEWSEFGGGYFGQIIGQQIGLALRYVLVIVAFYLIGRYVFKISSMIKLINLSGYCFIPWLIACIALIIIYSLWLDIGVLHFKSNLEQQLKASIIETRSYLGQRVIGFNAWLWTVILGTAMLSAYWKTKFIKSLVVMALAIAVVIGADMVGGSVLQRLGWIK